MHVFFFTEELFDQHNYAFASRSFQLWVYQKLECKKLFIRSCLSEGVEDWETVEAGWRDAGGDWRVASMLPNVKHFHISPLFWDICFRGKGKLEDF